MKSDPQNLPAGKDFNPILANNGKLRQQFLESPQATLESIQGLQPGELDGVDIRSVPVTPKTILITLPDKNYQLSDDELAAVAGGWSFAKKAFTQVGKNVVDNLKFKSIPKHARNFVDVIIPNQ